MTRDKHTGLPVRYITKKPHKQVSELLSLLAKSGVNTHDTSNLNKSLKIYMRDLANLYDRLDTTDSINYGIIDGVELADEEMHILNRLLNFTVVIKINTFLQAATDGNLDGMIMCVFKDAIRSYIMNGIDEIDGYVAIDATKIVYQTRDGRIVS